MTPATGAGTLKWIALPGGPLLALACYLVLPAQYTQSHTGQIAEFTVSGRMTFAVMAWMAVWWLTEAIHISATALLPLVLLSLTGTATIAQAAAPYADKLIFLFMGGFLLALSMQRWGLDRRIALVTLRLVGDRPTSMVGGIMLATAAISMFVSNTATAAMMLPITLSIVALVERHAGSDAGRQSNFAICMMLGMAYAASIGGLGTPIGTPPNGILVGVLERTYQTTVEFGTWMKVALPLMVVFLAVAWLLLTRLLHPVPHARLEGAAELVRREYAQLGPVKPGEWVTLIVFTLAALAWMSLHLLKRFIPSLDDAVIAMAAGLVLFVVPLSGRRREFVMDWATARKVPWEILILFGGGLSLADALQANGVAQFIASITTGFAAGGVPTVLVVLAVTATIVFVSEIASNTATAATLLPILAVMAPGLGINPYVLLFPAAFAASCGFMLPVSTPPNALAFSTGYLTVGQMCRAGLLLDLIGILLITALGVTLVAPLLGTP